MMNLRVVNYFSSDYFAMLALRIAILREPFDIPFYESDMTAERRDYFIGYFGENDNEIEGCCVLTPTEMCVVKLRQMAVKEDMQHKGIGTNVLQFAEKTAKENEYIEIVLSARKEAVGFYEKNGYAIVGNEFIEVGLPHFKMHKIIQ